MSKSFRQLKKSWGLSEGTSLSELHVIAERKLAAQPNNPELIYTLGEIQRQLGQLEEANKQYKKAVKVSDERTEARSKALEVRIKETRDKARSKLILLTLAPLILILFSAGIAWKSLSAPEPLPQGSDPNKFAFTQWLAKQQMAQIMTTLKQQNPELSFDFNRPTANSQNPMEFMQSLMQPDSLEKMKRDQQRAANKNSKKGSGQPAFQCSKEPAVHCAAKDIPNATGEQREEVVLLMEAYRSILATEKDCAKIEKSIETIGDQLQWRDSERRIKADLEDFAVECFYRENNLEKTIEHARKLQCTGDQGYISSVYWYLTAVTNKAGDLAKSQTSYQCFKESIDFIEKNTDFSPAYIASRHRESGALAWLYFNDLPTATSELEKARASLKSIKKKSAAVLEVIGEIDLDLLETYVTANIDLYTFDSLMHEINTSGRLTDGYKQIKDSLAVIYHMQNNQPEPALVALKNLTTRFKQMPEYICGWEWSGFRRGLQDSISDDDIRKQAIDVVDLANCYVKTPMAQRIQRANEVAKWIRGR